MLPQIKAAIEDSAFVSFDTEFTGLNIKDAPSVGPYDTALEAYEKLRQSANFSVIQFGLCTFHENPENGRLLIWLIFLKRRDSSHSHLISEFHIKLLTSTPYLPTTTSCAKQIVLNFWSAMEWTWTKCSVMVGQKLLIAIMFNINLYFFIGIVSLKKEEQEAKVAGLVEKLKGVKERASKPNLTQNLQASEGQKEVIAAIKWVACC